MKSKKEIAAELAQKISDAVFFYDPYIGADPEEMTDAAREDLRTLRGCYLIISELCDIIMEAN